jgi:hypothetical protein
LFLIFYIVYSIDFDLFLGPIRPPARDADYSFIFQSKGPMIFDLSLSFLKSSTRRLGTQSAVELFVFDLRGP